MGVMQPMVTYEHHESKTMHELHKQWGGFAKDHVEKVESSKLDIAVVNDCVKPVFNRSASIRKKRKITITRLISTKKFPRTRTFKVCYPVSTDINVETGSGIKTFTVTYGG